MTHYLLSVHHTADEVLPSPADMQKAFDQVDVFNQDLKTSGSFVFGGGLNPPTTATVVRTEGGKTVMTDGPFAETKEQLGGFWIITAADLDEALAWAEKGSIACMAPVEVRPFQDDTES